MTDDNYSNLIKNNQKISIKSKRTGESTILLDTQENICGDIVAGIPITECVDDTLDSFVFTIKGIQEKLYEPFDIVTLTVDDGKKVLEYSMLVQNDNAKLYQAWKNTYEHTVILIEQTKILEKIKIDNLTLTNEKDNLLQQAQKAINNAIPLISGSTFTDTCLFALSDALTEFLTGKKSEDFYFSNTDLRTVMDGILQSSNARCTVEKIDFNTAGDINKITIGYRSLSSVNEVVPTWTNQANGEIINKERKNNAQDYAGTIKAKGVNTLCKNAITITDSFKSGEATITTDNAKAMLPFPISENGIEHFYVKVKRTHGTAYTSMGAYIKGEEIDYIDVDIMSRLIQSEQYELLPNNDTSDYSKKNTIPFYIGSTSIGVSNSYKNFIVTYYNLNTAVNKFIGLNRNKYPSTEKIVYEGKEGTRSITYYLASITGNDGDAPCTFTCTYYPQIDTYASVTKPGVYDIDQIKLGIWDNQEEQTLDIDRHGKKLLSLIRRTGNDELYIDVNATYYSELLPLMSKIDEGYVVYKREISVFDRYCHCRYYLSKDYNSVQSKAGVNRQKHIFDIPLESCECPITVKEYMVFSKTAPTGGVDTTYKSSTVANALRTFTISGVGETYTMQVGKVTKYYTSGCKINYLLIKTYCGTEQFPYNTENAQGEFPYSDSHVFVKSTLNYGQGKSMYFVAKPLDNYSVDYSRDGYIFSLWGDKGNMITYCRYVSKNTNNVGECDKFSLSLAVECKFMEHGDNYSDEVYKNLMDSFPIERTEYFIKSNNDFTVNYKKDREQAPVFIMQIECVPSKEDFGGIIIGSLFAKENILVKGDLEDDPKIYIFKGDKFYDTDENIKGKNYEKQALSFGYFNIVETEYGAKLVYKNNYADNDNVTAWAITNDDGEIMIAVNGKLCDIYAYMGRYPKN